MKFRRDNGTDFDDRFEVDISQSQQETIAQKMTIRSFEFHTLFFRFGISSF